MLKHYVEVTYAEVAAIISTFVALLRVARAVEHSAEKKTIRPNRIFSLVVKFKTTIERMGSTEDSRIASSLRTDRIRLLEKIKSSPLEVESRCP